MDLCKWGVSELGDFQIVMWVLVNRRLPCEEQEMCTCWCGYLVHYDKGGIAQGM